jgi:hypothetical protein
VPELVLKIQELGVDKVQMEVSQSWALCFGSFFEQTEQNAKQLEKERLQEASKSNV